MRTIIAVHALVALLLIVTGVAHGAEPAYDINVYQTGTNRVIGQVRHLVTGEQAVRFLDNLRPEERTNGLYYLKTEPAENQPE